MSDASASRNVARRLPAHGAADRAGAGGRPAARAAVNIASALLRSGARAMVAGKPGMLVGQLQALGGEWVQFASASRNPFRVRSNANALTELIGNERIDVVHAYCGPAAWSARSAMRDTGAWLVTSHRGRAVRAPRPGIAVRRLARARAPRHRRIGIRGRSHSQALRRVRRPRGGDPRSIDTARFDPSGVSPERLAVLRHSWGIRPGWRVVLVPGRISDERGR